MGVVLVVIIAQKKRWPLHSDKYPCQNSWGTVGIILEVDVKTFKNK